jgi:hypothetical protein
MILPHHISTSEPHISLLKNTSDEPLIPCHSVLIVSRKPCFRSCGVDSMQYFSCFAPLTFERKSFAVPQDFLGIDIDLYSDLACASQVIPYDPPEADTTEGKVAFVFVERCTHAIRCGV